MKFILLFIPTLLCAQTLNVSFVPTSVKPGGQTRLNVVFADSTPASGITGFQFTIEPNAYFNLPSSAASISTSALQLACSDKICIVYSLTNTPIPDGTTVSFPLIVSNNAPVGNFPLTLTGPVAASSDGLNVPLTVVTGNLVIASPFDINLDGTISLLDITNSAQQADGSLPCTTADVNVDGKCNVIDTILTILNYISLGNH